MKNISAYEQYCAENPITLDLSKCPPSLPEMRALELNEKVQAGDTIKYTQGEASMTSTPFLETSEFVGRYVYEIICILGESDFKRTFLRKANP